MDQAIAVYVVFVSTVLILGLTERLCSTVTKFWE